jgi:hypothetical protein
VTSEKESVVERHHMMKARTIPNRVMPPNIFAEKITAEQSNSLPLIFHQPNDKTKPTSPATTSMTIAGSSPENVWSTATILDLTGFS